MSAQIARLRREARIAWMLAAFATLLCGFTLISGFTPRDRPRDVIRTRGIVIVDAQGRDRILMGAPIPASRSRIRGNFEKAKKAWGARYSGFDWYRSLEHSTNGIVLLDEHGYDRIVLGDPFPDPNVGKRIAPASGIAVNDHEGFERTGWGYFPTLNRTALGVDSPDGSEGVILGVLDDSTAGIVVMEGAPSIFLGHAGANHSLTGLRGSFNGLLIRQGDVVKHSLNSRADR